MAKKNKLKIIDQLQENPGKDVQPIPLENITDSEKCEKEYIPFLQAKLLIVGNGEVGKTTLMKKLKDNNFQVEVGKEITTHGINIVPWELQCTFENGDTETLKIHSWDFGGQDIYHATHQFFLTKRSLYLFVWEPRKEDETLTFDYWLNIIRFLSADSPVIVVMNKADIRIKHIDEASFKNKFKNIKAFLQVSCVTGEGIPDLTESIRSAFGYMHHLRDKLPKAWMDIRDHLKKEKKDYISVDDYYSICQKNGLVKEQARFVSGYLHDLGVILHFSNDRLLENTVILNPEWATEAVYTLVDTREIQENKGMFLFDDLQKYWDSRRYPRDKHLELIRLMEKFELCFPIIGTDMHIVPELLPAGRPPLDDEAYKSPGCLHFQYHYDFLPQGIITRFISRVYYLRVGDHYWKNGVELQYEGARAVVESVPLEKKLLVTLHGASQRELLAIIKNNFEVIHHTLNMEKNKHYQEMIPCSCGECSAARDPYVFPYDMLKKCLDKGIQYIPCARSVEMVEVALLLKGYDSPDPVTDLFTDLVETAHNLLGIANTIRSDEESRDGFISLLLSVHGYHLDDQARWSSPGKEKITGGIKIKAGKPGIAVEAAIDTFNLKDFDPGVIDSHVNMLLGHEPNGGQKNFILVYSGAEDFPGVWEKYVRHLDENGTIFRLTGFPEEIKTRFPGIKAARSQHQCENELRDIYHIFINMKERTGSIV